MNKIRRPRGGFTLAEVLVTIAILAVLAAVLLPVLSGQLRKGDISRVSADLTSMRTGVEAFLADVRRVPQKVGQLINPISTSLEDVNGAAYPVGLVARWNGPYIDKQQINDSIATGFGGMLVDSIIVDTTGAGLEWAAIRIAGLTDEEFDDIDLAIDGQVNSSTGKLRRTGTITRFLLIPIN